MRNDWWERDEKVFMKEFRKIIIIKEIILFSNFPFFSITSVSYVQNLQKLLKNK